MDSNTRKYYKKDTRTPDQVEATNLWAAGNVWKIVFSGMGLTGGGALISWYLSQMSPAQAEALRKVIFGG